MRWLSSIGGIIATAAAMAVLISLPAEAPPFAPVESPIEEAAPVTSPPQQIVSEPPVTHDMSVPDLTDNIADVLAKNGYTQFVGSSDLSETLPDEVVQVLIGEEAVLVIPSEPGDGN